jgi:hypothetical protein
MSQTGVPLDLYLIGGTNFNESKFFENQSGRGIDGAIQADATAAAQALFATNHKATVTLVDWPTLTRDLSVPANGLVQQEHGLEAAQPGTHDVMIVSFSRGAYLANDFARQLGGDSRIRRVQVVYLDPTGNKLIGDGALNPISNNKISTIGYHDNLTPYGSHYATGEQVIPGRYTYVAPFGNPISDGTKSHNEFPHWYLTSGQMIGDIMAFEQATTAELAAAQAAVRNHGPYHIVTYSAPGNGTNLLIPLLEAAALQGIDTLIDDAGDIIKTVASHPGQFVISFVTDAGHLLESTVNSAGTILSTVDKGIHKVEDLFSSIVDPFDWF